MENRHNYRYAFQILDYDVDEFKYTKTIETKIVHDRTWLMHDSDSPQNNFSTKILFDPDDSSNNTLLLLFDLIGDINEKIVLIEYLDEENNKDRES